MVREKNFIFLLAFLILIAVSIGLISAADPIINFSSGATSVVVSANTTNLFNISVNNPDTSQNISAVNVSFFGNFIFKAASNGTSAAWESFTNTSSVINWFNSSGLVRNVSTSYFWFNATASAAPGTYNITVTTTYLNTTSLISNLSVTVNDTTPPNLVEFVGPSASNGSTVNYGIPINVSAEDNINVTVVRIYLYYTNGTLVNNTNTSATSRFLNFTNLNQGQTYHINATVIDANNLVNNSLTRIVTLNDTTPPNLVEFVDPSSSNGSTVNYGIPINVSAADNINVTEVRIYVYYSNGTLVNNTNTSATSRFLNFTNLNQGQTYHINATVIDANNLVNNSLTRIVTLNDTTSPNSLQFTSPTPTNNSISIFRIPINISATDNYNVSSIRIFLYFANGTLVNNTNVSSSNSFLNFTGLSTGATYHVNATAVDSNTNQNLTSGTRVYIFVSQVFSFNGTTYNSSGSALNNTVVNVTVSTMGNQGLTTLGYYPATSNASGWFSVNLPSFPSWMYKPVLRHTSSSTNAIDFVGASVPDFPQQEFAQLNGINFHLKQAGTINITAINSSGDRITFNYQVKDTKLGYPIAYDFTSAVNEALIYVPTDRNYSVMIYPSQSLPVSFNWNNFSSTASYNFGAEYPATNLSRYNATTKTVHKQFNTTNNLIRLTGYINVTGISGWNEFKVAAILLEPGNMVYLQYGVLPHNMSAWSGNTLTDVYNLSVGWASASGYYNITVPGPAETQTILLFASARNGTNYYGGFKNISLSYTTAAAEYNFTKMYGMLGDASNLSQNNPTSQGITNMTCKKQTFNILNSTNATFTNTAHVEATVDYSSYGAMEFTFMEDVAQNAGAFSIPLLNVTGVKEFNVFSAQGAPKRLAKTASEIASNNNITLSNFNPGDIGGALASNQITIAMYISNSTCDVPNPSDTCLVTSSGNLATFNPLSAVIGGGAISFRMGVNSSGILIHYVNVDMLASGPPDGLFENESGASESSSSFSNAMKFGSGGPTMYDYVLISMPYVEGSSSTTGLNDSLDVNLSIPTFYGQDANGNMDWNTPIWTSSNGTNATALAGNYSHYSTYSNQWQSLMAPTNCTTNASVLNSTIPCYVDRANNRIWVRLPHFSGTGASVSGSLVTAASSSSSSSSSGGSGGSGTAFWINTQSVSEKQFTNGYTQQLNKKYRLQISVEKKFHYIGVIDLTKTTVTINISSKSVQSVFNIGDEKKFDLTDDRIYDLSVKLNSISNNKANITIKKISESIVAEAPAVTAPAPETTAETTPPAETATVSSQGKTSVLSITIVLVIVGIIIIALIFYFIKRRNPQKVQRRIKVFDFY